MTTQSQQKTTLRAEKGNMTKQIQTVGEEIMKNKPLKNGQKVLIIKNNPRGYARVGDLAIQTGWDGKQNQFHDTYMQPTHERDENYWVEELDDDCYIVLNDAQAIQEAVERERERCYQIAISTKSVIGRSPLAEEIAAKIKSGEALQKEKK